MRGPSDTSRFVSHGPVSASLNKGSLEGRMHEGRFVPSVQGLYFDLPEPVSSHIGRELMFSNPTAGWHTLHQEDSKFVGGLKQVALGPYETALVEYGDSEVAAGLHICVTGIPMPIPAQGSTPTPTWTTANATVTSSVMTYALYKGVCIGEYHASGTDGGGATQISVPLPYTPQYVQAKVFAAGVKSIDGSVTDCVPYIAADQSTAANRVLTMGVPGTLTDDKAWEIHVKFWYPVYGFSAYTPTLAWGTADPASITTNAVYKEVDGFMFVAGMTSSQNNNAASSLTVSTPVNVVPDTDSYISISSGILSNTTWVNGQAYLDANNATEASRLFGFSKWPTMTSGQAIAVGWAAIYPMDGGIDWHSEVGQVWTTGTPASVSPKARYGMIGREYCWFEIYMTSADSNGATNLTAKCPMTPMLQDNDVRINCHVMNNATPVMPQAKILASESDPADRIIVCDAFPTCTDAQLVTVRLSGVFRVAG